MKTAIAVLATLWVVLAVLIAGTVFVPLAISLLVRVL